MELGEPRKWVPDVNMMADQLVEDYRAADCEGLDESQGFLDAISTIQSWQETAADHREEITENDWVKLVSELARRVAAGGTAAPSGDHARGDE